MDDSIHAAVDPRHVGAEVLNRYEQLLLEKAHLEAENEMLISQRDVAYEQYDELEQRYFKLKAG